jgi:hypothetical protein
MAIRDFWTEFYRLFNLAMQAPDSAYHEGFMDSLYEVHEIAEEHLDGDDA